MLQRFRQKNNLAAHVMKMHTPKGLTWKPPKHSERHDRITECQICNKVNQFNSTIKVLAINLTNLKKLFILGVEEQIFF